MRILLVGQRQPKGAHPTFIDRDFQILREVYETREISFSGLRDVLRLLAGVWWADCTFSWFGKLQAFFAVLFSKAMGKRAVVVAGDDDVTKTKIGGRPWGLCAHPVKKWFAYTLFHFADLVIAISEFTRSEAINNAKARPQRTKLIYHGVDANEFRKITTVPKEPNTVITVAHIKRENFERKGLRLFVESAYFLPEFRFTMVGPALDEGFQILQEKAPPNVAFAGGLVGEDLIGALSKARVYVQASELESFGVSLAEAMLCECVPVVSRLGALPEVVGDAGYYLECLEAQELADKVKIAMADPEMGKMARQRIMEHFSLRKRKEELLAAIENLWRPAN